MKIKKFNKNLGFSLVELLITLGIGSTLIFGAVSYYNKVSNDNARRNQAKTLVNYSKGVYSFVANNQALFYNNKTTMPIVTISQDQLIQSGIINKSEFNDIVDNQTGAKLYPCSVIFYNNNKLQGLIYYRTDNPKMDIANADSNQIGKSTAQLLYSLKTLGASGSIITKDDKSNSYVLKTNNASWNLTPTQMNQFFVKSGGDLFGDGLSQCKGQYIATPSYVFTINNQLNNIQGELSSESNIKQNTNEILTSNPNNLVDTVNLDSTGLSAKAYNTNNNKLVFQSSSTCTMNPSILSTMQDYDPNCPGPNCSNDSYKYYSCNSTSDSNCSGINIPNKFGCRNKQLTVGLQSANVCNAGQGDCNTSQPKQLNAIMINGFNQANTGYTTALTQGYLGGLNADSIQATAQESYGDSCADAEIGTMAQQQSYPDTTALNKLYNLNQSLLVCQKSLLCAASSKFDGTDTSAIKACWLPLSTVTVDINFNVNDKVLAFEAPSGFYIKSVEYYDKDETVWIGDYGNNTQFGLQRADGIYGSYTREGICRKEVNNGIGGLCHTETHGDILNMPNNILTAIPNGNIYAPYKATFSNLYNPSDSTTLKGFGGIIDKLKVKSFDFTNYFTSCANGDQNSGPCAYVTNNNNSATNYTNNALKQFNYKFGISFAYQVNPKFAIRQSRWRHYGNGCNNLSDCDNWKFGKFLTIPYYIKKITLSNDTDNIALDSNNPPPSPPIPPPPSGQCSTTANMPAYMNQEAKDAMNNYNYDPNTGNQLVLSKSNNFNITSTNSNQYNCNVQATANYCPAKSNDCLKYSYYTNYGSCSVGQGVCDANTYFNTPGCGGSHGRQYLCGTCSTGGDPGDHNACWGQQCVQYADSANCSNPITKIVYTNTYTFQ